MKKQAVKIILVAGMSINMGCVSYYNHSRVVDNTYRERIAVYGSPQQKQMMNMGVSPRAVAISATANENETSARIMMDLADFQGIKGYFKSYAKSPVSSTFALATDVVGSYFIVKYGSKEYEKMNSGSSSVSYEVNGDNNRIVHQDGTTSSSASASGNSNTGSGGQGTME